MTARILLRDGVSRQAMSSGIRHEITDVNLDERVSVLRAKAALLLQLKAEEIDLVYCGRVLCDDMSLASCGISASSTVLALKKTRFPEPTQATGQQLDSATMHRLLTSVRAVRTHQNFRPTLEAALSNPSTVHSIVQGSRELAADPIAIALLGDADLLMLTLSDSIARLRVFEAHPALCDAVIALMNVVSKDLHKKTPATASRQQYNLDRMDAEEGGIEDEADDDAEMNSDRFSNLLPRDQQQQQQEFITTDFFRQAMLAATAQNTPGSNVAGAVPARPVVTEDQLRQLRDMGITDEALARRALEVSGGDIQAALEFIFGDDM